LESEYTVEHKPFSQYFDHPLGKRIYPHLFSERYKTLYLDGQNDDTMLGTPDLDHQIVAMMLRIHLTPSEPMGALFPLKGNILPIEDRDEFS
jgi:hypothetical protein